MSVRWREGPPPGHLPPGPLSRFRQQPFLGLPVTQCEATQGLLYWLSSRRPAQSWPQPMRSSPCPHQGPFFSAGWVLNPIVQSCPLWTKTPFESGKGKESVEWAGGGQQAWSHQPGRDGWGGTAAAASVAPRGWPVWEPLCRPLLLFTDRPAFPTPLPQLAYPPLGPPRRAQ